MVYGMFRREYRLMPGLLCPDAITAALHLHHSKDEDMCHLLTQGGSDATAHRGNQLGGHDVRQAVKYATGCLNVSKSRPCNGLGVLR